MRNEYFIMDDDGTIDRLAKNMEKFLKRSMTGVENDLVDFTFQLRDEVRSRATGRPGPNKVSGAYWHSIVVLGNVRKKFLRKSTLSMGVITTHPAAWRLEMGYVGVDAMGRHYNQPPFPHWRPAREVVAARWKKKSEETLVSSWKKR